MVAILKNLDRTAKGREQISRATPGRPHLRLVGGYLEELAILGKAIQLSSLEARKFANSATAKHYNYSTSPKMPRVRCYSDASGDWCEDGVLFLKKE